MLSLKQLLTIAACAAVTLALSDAIKAHCDEPKLLHNTPIEVDGKVVSFTGFSCAPSQVSSRAISKRDVVDVCGEICTNSCNNNAGSLPPILDDCQQIKDAITIFEGTSSPTFIVRTGTIQVLSFGTCTFFFKSTTNDHDISACWTDLSIKASSAGSSCFPPVMPFFSEGLCSALDKTWEIGIAHS